MKKIFKKIRHRMLPFRKFNNIVGIILWKIHLKKEK